MKQMYRPLWLALLLLASMTTASRVAAQDYTSCGSCEEQSEPEVALVEQMYPVADILHGYAKCPKCPDYLVKVIPQVVAPASWCGQGGKGSIEFCVSCDKLVVTQTPAVQKQVGDFLKVVDKMAAAASKSKVDAATGCVKKGCGCASTKAAPAADAACVCKPAKDPCCCTAQSACGCKAEKAKDPCCCGTKAASGCKAEKVKDSCCCGAKTACGCKAEKAKDSCCCGAKTACGCKAAKSACACAGKAACSCGTDKGSCCCGAKTACGCKMATTDCGCTGATTPCSCGTAKTPAKHHFRFVIDGLKYEDSEKNGITIQHFEVEYTGDGMDEPESGKPVAGTVKADKVSRCTMEQILKMLNCPCGPCCPAPASEASETPNE
ncbi:MAG: hypothetical protein K2R98_33465 [Gemmataceae bacterium]|nr:hypothetical protein [Gemmataceae bacterium]